MTDPFENIGQSILDDILKADIIYAEEEDVIVWNTRSPEVLEAIMAKYCHEMHRRILNGYQEPPDCGPAQNQQNL